VSSAGVISFAETEGALNAGQVEGRITVNSIGMYELYLYLLGKAVKGSLFVISFVSGGFALDHLKLEGLNDTIIAGEKFSLRFRLGDKFGNPVMQKLNCMAHRIVQEHL